MLNSHLNALLLTKHKIYTYYWNQPAAIFFLFLYEHTIVLNTEVLFIHFNATDMCVFSLGRNPNRFVEFRWYLDEFDD